MGSNTGVNMAYLNKSKGGGGGKENEPKFYKITENEATIPDDADIVELDIDAIKDPSIDYQSVRVYLPQNPKHFSTLRIFCTHSFMDGNSVSAQVWRNKIADRSIEYVYEKQCLDLRYNPSRNSWCYSSFWHSDDGQERE